MNKFMQKFVIANAIGLVASIGVVAFADDQPAQATPPASAGQMSASQLDQVIAGTWRSEKNKARDTYRHPKEMLKFFGIRPDMTVIEIWPSGGWFTEILAPFLNANGQYIGAVPPGSKSTVALQNKFKFAPQQYSKAKLVEFDNKAPNLGPDGSADMVLTFRNVHNWAADGSAEAMFKAMYRVLKPGGVLGVEDHRASKGKTLDQVVNTGYLPTEYVIKLATDAGFKLDGQSEINANPKDNHDHPKGVWTLPPTYELGEQDKAKYAAIGESDRMTLRFVKPAAK
ncbi:methyltransferase domain-containing protein [Luteibacter aegosomatis]|uniref:class I SAM-dependent methyltransferase n=1 Tax=Luteibacter aegosomatis TaxID=2911537 RepID=UPI001FF9E767|nr:methyltransferase domain-containing protein [Luteibacter aegosomatis]UPG86167.1 methyltransferase domain-containing protein [Luteibacter aegosomatis]